MEYKCPLCEQPVSPKLYQKITGIWKERQRLLKQVKEERAKLRQKIAKEKKKLKVEKEKFKRQQKVLIKKAVDKQAKRSEEQIEALRKKEKRAEEQARSKLQRAKAQVESLREREKQIERQAQDKIKETTAKAHAQVAKRLKILEDKLKRKLKTSMRARLKLERERAKKGVEEKYTRLQRTFKATLQSMGSKNREIARQRTEIDELKRQLERQTTPQIEGLLYENVLARELKKRFKGDGIRHTGKGGDIIQCVMYGKEQAGVIVYECKRVKQHQSAHIEQAAKAKRTRNADFAILVTKASKHGTHGFFTERGVAVVHPSGVLALAGILREQILEIARMKIGRTQKDKAIRLILGYLEGPEFKNSMGTIIDETLVLQKDLINEIKKHEQSWRKRHEAHAKLRDEAFTVKEKSRILLSGKPNEQPAEPPEIPSIPESIQLKKKKKVAVETA